MSEEAEKVITLNLMQEANAVQSAMEWAAITLGLMSILVQVATCVLIVAAKRRKKEDIHPYAVSFVRAPTYALWLLSAFPFGWFALFRFRFFLVCAASRDVGLLDSVPRIIVTRRSWLTYGERIRAHRITKRIYLEA